MGDSEAPSREDVQIELEAAKEALADAQVLLDAGGSSGGAVNRLYYTCFHAAQAVLYDRGINPHTHDRVISAFGKEVVLEGDATREMGRLLSDLQDYRLQADYEGRGPDVDVKALLPDVREFLNHAETLVTVADK